MFYLLSLSFDKNLQPTRDRMSPSIVGSTPNTINWYHRLPFSLPPLETLHYEVKSNLNEGLWERDP